MLHVLGICSVSVFEVETVLAPSVPSQPKTNGEVDTPYDSVQLVLELPPDNGCGAITAFIVRDSATGNQLMSSYSVTDGVVTITVTGLEPEQDYEVQVYARNENQFESKASEAVEFNTSQSKLDRDLINVFSPVYMPAAMCNVFMLVTDAEPLASNDGK